MITFSDGTAHRLAVDPGAADVRLGHDPISGEIITRQVCTDIFHIYLYFLFKYVNGTTLTNSTHITFTPKNLVVLVHVQYFHFV